MRSSPKANPLGVRVGARGERLEDGGVGRLLACRVEQLAGEAEHPAVEHVDRRVRELRREARPEERPGDAVEVGEQRQAHLRPQGEERGRPGVPADERPATPRPAPDRLLPIDVGGRRLDLADQEVGHPVEQLVLAADVVVERHRLDAELLADPPHRDRAEALRVGDGDGRAEDAVAVQRHAAGAGLTGHR